MAKVQDNCTRPFCFLREVAVGGRDFALDLDRARVM